MLRNFKRPDLNGPRFRLCSMQLLNKSFYEKVRAESNELSMLSDLDIKQIIQICGEVIQDMVIQLPDGVELPEQLGYLFIGSTPATKKGNIDYKRSIELGKEVRHENEETGELTVKIFYTNHGTKYRFKYNDIWMFKPVRQFKRTVSAKYSLDYKKYVKVDRKVKVSGMFKKEKRADQL